MLQIDAEGDIGAFANALGEVSDKFKSLEKDLEKTALGLFADEASNYPGEPPGHKYKRSGDLKKEWQRAKGDLYADDSGEEVSLSLKNKLPYAAAVQGNQQHDTYREIGWKSEDEMFDPIWEMAMDELAKGAEKILEDTTR